MATSASGLIAAGQGISAITGFAQSIAEARALRARADFQERVALQNARISRLQGEQAVKRGELAAQLRLRQAAQEIGRQRVALAAQGVQLDEGTALQLAQDAAGIGALDAETLRGNAFQEAWGFRVQAVSEETRAEFARIAGRSGARTTLLAGAAGFGRDLFGIAETIRPRGRARFGRATTTTAGRLTVEGTTAALAGAPSFAAQGAAIGAFGELQRGR